MKNHSVKDKLVKHLPGGARHYKAYVGPPGSYDLVSAMQFNLMTLLGLREHHTLLDLGCGSLRGGKLFIPFLLPRHYFGIEPEQWLIEEGIRKELGQDLIRIKRPTFSNDRNFTLSVFNEKFDFILAQSIFSHASETQIRRCLSEASKVMKTTSIFAASFLRGEKNYSGNKWVYPWSVTYTLDRMVQLSKEHGLVCKSLDWPHPNLLSWLLIVRPENEHNIPDLSSARLLRMETELRYYREASFRLLKPVLRLNDFILLMRQWREMIEKSFTRARISIRIL